MDRIADPAEPALEEVWDKEWEQHVRTAALRRVKSRVDPLQYQIFDLCVLRGAEPKIVAAKLGVKLIFPIFFCILPSLFVVTVGPMAVRVVRELLPMMNNM